MASNIDGEIKQPLSAPWSGGSSADAQTRAQFNWRPDVTDAELLVNQPRNRHGELLVSLCIAVIVGLVTCWILVAMVLPIFRQDLAYMYSVLLTVLGIFALCASFYIFQIGWGAFHWTRKYRLAKETDWYSEWAKAKAEEAAPLMRERDRHTVLEWERVVHFVVVTNYKEPMEVLRLLAYTLMSQRVEGFCRHQIILVWAFEEREGEAARQKADVLTAELRPFFRDVISTFHPPDLPGDIKGKASNFKWAVGEVERYVQIGPGRSAGILEGQCIVHVADADSLFDPNHFPFVTYTFCTRSDRHELVFQPCMIATCNFWEVPPPCRQLSTMVAAQEMMSAFDPKEFQIPFSTYGMTLQTLQVVGGTGHAVDAQDGDVIAEDHHLFIKAFFALEGRLKVEPIFLPCLNFSVGGEAQSLCSNLYDRFVQAKRHMFGVSELIYFLALVARCFSRRWRVRFGFRGWVRVGRLFYKLVKIHSLGYLGFWVTLGLILIAVLKVNKSYCDGAYQNPSVSRLMCGQTLTKTTETVGAAVFSFTSSLSVFGSMFVIIAFVRMLRATQHTLTNIADPHGSFMGPAVWSSDGGSRLRRTSSQEWLRRPMPVGSGYPWCGAVTQLVIEFVAFGFITSVVYGTIPCFIALWHLIWRGHRLEYVAAHGAGHAPQENPRNAG